jgi:hypothetical protein
VRRGALQSVNRQTLYALERVQRQPLVDLLAHLVRGHQVEGQVGHHAQRAQPDDHPVEALVAARHGDQVALGGHQVEG